MRLRNTVVKNTLTLHVIKGKSVNSEINTDLISHNWKAGYHPHQILKSLFTMYYIPWLHGLQDSVNSSNQSTPMSPLLFYMSMYMTTWLSLEGITICRPLRQHLWRRDMLADLFRNNPNSILRWYNLTTQKEETGVSTWQRNSRVVIAIYSILHI